MYYLKTIHVPKGNHSNSNYTLLNIRNCCIYNWVLIYNIYNYEAENMNNEYRIQNGFIFITIFKNMHLLLKHTGS